MRAIEQAEKIYTICAKAAKEGNTITYQQVLSGLGYKGKIGGHAIRYGLELAWIACLDKGLPSLTAIVVNQASGAPSDGYSVENWRQEADAVFVVKKWPPVDSIDWEYIWRNRIILSDRLGTRGYWRKE
jgi:hypothetical protein